MAPLWTPYGPNDPLGSLDVPAHAHSARARHTCTVRVYTAHACIVRMYMATCPAATRICELDGPRPVCVTLCVCDPVCDALCV